MNPKTFYTKPQYCDQRYSCKYVKVFECVCERECGFWIYPTKHKRSKLLL